MDTEVSLEIVEEEKNILWSIGKEMLIKVTRAEYRRAEKALDQKKKTFVMTAEELDKVRHQEFARAKKILMDKNDELAEEILQMMLVIPTNILISDYWQKTAKKRIP